jgi:hypothetical protein
MQHGAIAGDAGVALGGKLPIAGKDCMKAP